jgi:hypothetical protein
VVAAGAGVPAVSAEGPAGAVGVAASAAVGMTVSEEGLTVAAGPVAATGCFAESVRGWAEGRVRWTAFAAGAAASTGGVLTVAADGTTVSVGAAAPTAGVLTVAEDGLAVAAGTAASAAGVLAVADGVAGAAGVLTAAAAAGALTVVPGGGLPVVTGGAAVAAGATAVAAQCSEITFSPVTAKLLSAAPELAVPLVLCPVRLTSSPRCSLRSTLLVLILRI